MASTPPPHHQPTPNCPNPPILKPSPYDEYLSTTTHLSRLQVLRRRSHNLRQLSHCYRDHYWSLIEEIRVRYREYLFQYGTSPVIQDFNEDDVKLDPIRDGIERIEEKYEEIGDDVSNGVGCVFDGCKMKAMTLTQFCHVHILNDPMQQLYKPCEFFLKSVHGGLVPCGKPVLRSIVPSLCSMHFLKAQQHVFRALRKAGCNINSTNKFSPKLHVIVAEYVREIQEQRRKNGSMANKKKIVPKLEIEN